MHGGDIEELDYTSYPNVLKAKWDHIYSSDSKRILEGKEPPRVIKTLLDFSYRNVESIYIVCYSDFYSKQKAKLPRAKPVMVVSQYSPFNPLDWNFTKAPKEQIIGKFNNDLLLTSASPLCRYHCIFVPSYTSELPQVITKATDCIPVIKLLANDTRTDGKIFFSGYCAGASVNHLHYQLVYIKQLINEELLPIERLTDSIPLISLKPYDVPIAVYSNTSYLLPYIKIALIDSTLNDKVLLALSEVIYATVLGIYNSGNSINIVFTVNGKHTYVIPRKLSTFSVMPDIGIGAFECCGLGICGSAKVYNECDAKFYMDYVKEYGVDIEAFKKIEELVLVNLKGTVQV